MRTSTIVIDTKALQHNLHQVKRLAPKAKVLAMVKADAYGHGMANCLNALADSDAIGVACYSEAKHARVLGWAKAIVLIEGVFSALEWQQALSFECQSVIHHLPQVAWAIEHPPSLQSPSRTVWLKLNTGMNRLGFEPTDIIAIAKRLKAAGYALILTSHFANADVATHPSNWQQIQVFRQVLSQLQHHVDPSIQASLCNSAGIINFPDAHFNWVRPGIMLYGSSPLAPHCKTAINLQPVMRFGADLIAIHNLPEGVSIGYGSTYTTSQPMVKGMISVGYGDGYPRVVNDTAWVALHQHGMTYPCPIIGRVSMDMIAIDISTVPEPAIGAAVTLWGSNMINDSNNARANNANVSHNNVSHSNANSNVPTIDDVAIAANTISYDILCRMTQRPVRHIM